MRATWLLAVAVAACTPAPAPAPAPPAAHVPTLADVAWIAGTWHADGLDAHWQEIAGAIYGVSLVGSGKDSDFVVTVIADHDDDGHPTPLTQFSLAPHQRPTTDALVSATATENTWRGSDGTTEHVAKTARGWRAEYTPPGRPASVLEATPGQLAAAPELVAAERQFAADAKARGAAGWASWFAPDGDEWTGSAVISGTAAIAEHIAPTLQHGVLDWTPLADGKLGDLGYTLGTWTFTAAAPAGVAHGSYCTVWRHQPDGSWKVALDLGRPAS